MSDAHGTQSKSQPGGAHVPRAPCLCGCGTPTTRGDFAPGHDRRADALLTEIEFGTVAERVRAWMRQQPGRTIAEEYELRHPTADPRMSQARTLVGKYVRPSSRLASDELIAERRREAARDASSAGC